MIEPEGNDENAGSLAWFLSAEYMLWTPSVLKDAEERFYRHRQTLKNDCSHKSTFSDMPSFDLLDVFFESHPFAYASAPRENSGSLVNLLRTGEGNCVALTAFCLALLDSVGKTAVPVAVERHVFLSSLDSPDYYFDASTGNKQVYKKLQWYHHIRFSSYCLSLSVDQFQLLYAANIAAFSCVPAGKVELALKILDKVNCLFPEYPPAWVNRWILLRSLERKSEADGQLETMLQQDTVRRYWEKHFGHGSATGSEENLIF